MTIPQLLALAPQTGVYLRAPEAEPLDFATLGAQVARTVERLNVLGIGRGDVVAAVLPNGPELACAFFAVSAAAAFAPLNPAYREAEFRFLLADLNARALITIPGFSPDAEAACHSLGVPMLALRRCGPRAGCFEVEGARLGTAAAPGWASEGDTALLLHSSGTTARPKLIPLRHRSLCVSARNIAWSLALTPEDVSLNVMPLFHVHGLIGALLASAAAGAAVYCSAGFNAYTFPRSLEESGATWYTAVPSMHQAIVLRAAAGRFRHGLRFVRSCSAHLHPRVAAELESAFGVPAVNAYGMTEASHQITCNPLPPGVRKQGTAGVSTGTEVAVMDEEGRLLAPGCEGEVVLRGDAVASGYLVPEEANRTAFTNAWFRTGDQGILDEDGYLTLTGRLKEIINCGGEKISPAEIDAVLMDHPGVAAVLAFGAPSRWTGEQVCAAVTLREGASVSEIELKTYLRDRLAKFKVPRRIVFLETIPRGATGKLQRAGMAARLGLGEAAD